MKEFKGSKTPWKVESVPSGLDVWNEEHCICLVDSYNVAGYDANAHLIAAAPDLLAACLEFIRKVDAGEAKSTRSYEQMKAACNKALNH